MQTAQHLTQSPTQAQQLVGGIRRLRARLATLNDDIATMIALELHLADNHGWDAPQVEAIDADIRRFELERERLLANIHALEAASVALQTVRVTQAQVAR